MNELRDVSSLSERYDIVVVGAGPAGLAAATTSSELGASTLVLDENAGPGGQIYRAVTSTPVGAREILGEDYWRGAKLATAFRASSSSYARGATVWSVGPALDESGRSEALEIGVSLGGSARLIKAREVILATGALERPFPIPGWTLPGVMTAGAAQIALKSSGLVPDGRVVVAGCGPLLYLLTEQLRAAGANIVALIETTPRANWAQALRQFPDFIRSPYLTKGLKLLWGARRHLRIVSGATGLQASGDGRMTEVTFRRRGKEERLACDLLLLHQGVVPNINLSNATGCVHDWDDGQLAWIPRVDEWFLSTVPGVSIAGDGAGIAGAESAPLRGRIAAIAAATRLGLIGADERDRRATPVRAELSRALRGRLFLDALYQPAKAVPDSGRGERHGVPLRGGDGGPNPGDCRARRGRPQPDEVLPALRHGTVPGPPLRPHRDGDDRRRAGRSAPGGRVLSPASAGEAGHSGRARSTAEDRGCDESRRAVTHHAARRHRHRRRHPRLLDRAALRAARAEGAPAGEGLRRPALVGRERRGRAAARAGCGRDPALRLFDGALAPHRRTRRRRLRLHLRRSGAGGRDPGRVRELPGSGPGAERARVPPRGTHRRRGVAPPRARRGRDLPGRHRVPPRWRRRSVPDDAGLSAQGREARGARPGRRHGDRRHARGLDMDRADKRRLVRGSR